jgi:hypothetical protein
MNMFLAERAMEFGIMPLNIVRQLLPELHSDWGEHWGRSATSLERRVGAGDRKTVGNPQHARANEGGAPSVS